MSADRIEPGTTAPVVDQDSPAGQFDAALASAWQGEWERRVVARDEAKAAGNDALVQHFQAELDVMQAAMPTAAAQQAAPVVAEQPPAAQLPVTQEQPVEVSPQQDAPPLALDFQKKSVLPPQERPADGSNSITFSNDNPTESMTITFTHNPDSAAIPAITLKPGETLVQAFPEGWSGNFRSAEGDGVNVTLGEVKFDGGGGQTYYDVSYIEGYNVAMTIEPVEGGRQSGTLQDLASSAPQSIIARDADANAYGLRKTTVANVVDQEVVDYYRGKVGADEGYVIPTDDASTLGSGSGALSVHLT